MVSRIVDGGHYEHAGVTVISTQGLIQSEWLKGSRVAGFAAVAVVLQEWQQWQ